MAVDEELNARMRAALKGKRGIEEKKMMGGVCFMWKGHMLGGAHREKTGEGRFMFRVGKEQEAAAFARPGARPMQIGNGRTMGGFVFVDEDACPPDALKEWAEMAKAFIRTLPPR